MALTVAQRTDLQGDLGIDADEAVFTNDELDRLYARADSDYNLAVYYGYRQLLAQANKFHNYTEGMTRVERVQMRDNIASSMEFWEAEARQKVQARMIGLNSIPPRDKDKPDA